MPEVDNVPPPQRKLGPRAPEYTTVPFSLTIGNVDFQLRKYVALTTRSLDTAPGFLGEFLDGLTLLTSQFLFRLIAQLHRFVEAQRHTRPGITDLALCLDSLHISPNDLYAEYVRTRELPEDVKLDCQVVQMELTAFFHEYNADNYSLDRDDPAIVFYANEMEDVAALVPQQLEKPKYIPSYLPDLPPDYTYQTTGSYMETITEPKQIKLKLVEELRLNERSLYKLIDDRERRQRAQLERDLQNVSEDESLSEDEEPALPKDTGVFDFVAYAAKRKRAKARAKEEVAQRIAQREANIFIKAEEIFSPYALRKATAEEVRFYEDVLETGFKKVIKAVRAAEEKKTRQLVELLAERERKRKEMEQQEGSFQFGFNVQRHLSDESEEELDEIVFGDAVPTIEEKDEVVEDTHELGTHTFGPPSQHPVQPSATPTPSQYGTPQPSQYAPQNTQPGQLSGQYPRPALAPRPGLGYLQGLQGQQFQGPQGQQFALHPLSLPQFSLSQPQFSLSQPQFSPGQPQFPPGQPQFSLSQFSQVPQSQSQGTQFAPGLQFSQPPFQPSYAGQVQFPYQGSGANAMYQQFSEPSYSQPQTMQDMDDYDMTMDDDMDFQKELDSVLNGD